MSKAVRRRTTVKLGVGNTVRGRGRLVILVLILAASLVVRTAVSLVQVSLCREAVGTVTCSGPLPAGFTSLTILPDLAPVADSLPTPGGHSVDLGGPAFPAPSTSDPASAPIVGRWEQAFGPTGYLELVRLYPSDAGDAPERAWFVEIRGRFPLEPDEVAIPETLADLTGLGPGDSLGFGTQPLIVSGVYKPLGVGPACQCLLSVPDPAQATNVNFSLNRETDSHGRLKISQTQTAIGYSQTTIISAGFKSGAGAGGWERVSGRPVKERTEALAQAVYHAQGTAVNLGFALVGVAVFLILIIALHDRRRELASYKLAGVDAVGAASVLGVELALTCGLAVAVAGPVFWLVAAWRLVPAHPSVTPLLVGAFVVNLVWVTLTVALAALYPLLLAAVASPSQLLAGQRIFLFRRRRELRGWLE